MRKRQTGWLIVPILCCCLLVSAAVHEIDQETDDEAESRRVVLGFMKGREKTPQNPARRQVEPRRERPVADEEDEPLGFGLTIFQRNERGRAQRVPFSTIFHSGDAARLAVEPGADGFLYIFHTENDGPARMIYPSHFLREGLNKVDAHHPYEVPSRSERQFQWFEFFGKPATERLYVVLARKPLPEIPLGKALASLCGKENPRCLWTAPRAKWRQLTEGLQNPARVGTSREFGQEETAEEGEAFARDFGLPPGAPPLRWFICPNAPARSFSSAG